MPRFKRPYRPRESATVSVVMSAIRGRENKTEVALRKEIWRRGLRYRLYSPGLPGRPDLVFPVARVAVFVDGDFWHGRILREEGVAALRATFRGRRRGWWVRKITRTAARDRMVTAALRADDWRVIRLWEKDARQDIPGVAARIARIVRGQPDEG